MSTISQSIPNLLLGISQQPDNRKRPGQVKDAQNVFPDFALGMLKRPGGKFVAKLDNAQPRGKWFPILRDGTEKYIGQYDTTDHLFRIWNLSDGIRRVVDMGSNSGQPGGCSIPNLTTTFTNVANAKHALNAAETALQVAASDLSKKTAGQLPTLNTVFATDFRKYSNPRSEDYSKLLTEEVKSGVVEIDGNAKQATATVSVSNAITAVGVSDGGSGYTSAPTVTIAGSGSNATATAVLSDRGDLSSINITNAGAEYIDVPTVTFGGGLSGYQGTAVVNWFTKQVTKVLVEDGDVIDITDENERYETNGNIAKRDSLYGSGGNDTEGNRLLSDQLGFNTGRPNMTFMAGSGLTTGPLGLYLKPRDLTGKSKIRIMAVTANTRFVQGVGNVVANTTAPANGLDTIDGGNSGTYELGTHNGGLYNDFGSPFNSLGVPTLDVYIAKEGVTSLDNSGNTNPIWNNGSSVSGDPPDNSFILALPRFSSGTDWRHIGEIIPANPATNTDEPYYLSEYEFNIPADLQTTGCYICIGSSNQSPSIGQADSSRRFAVTTLTLVNAVPTTTNIADSTVTFNVNAKSANTQSLFPRWNTRDGLHPFYFDKLLTFRNGVVTPTTPTTTAVADVILRKSVADLTLTDAGSGYNVGQATTISLSGGNFTQAATPTITVTPTFTATITEAGKGYKSATATMTGGGGSGAEPTVQTLNGLVTGVTFTGGNSNYLSNPTITLSTPNTDNARYADTIYKKDGVILTGALTHVDVKEMGQGLVAASATNVATTTNGTGTGVTVDLTVTNNQVTAVSLNTNGTGYYTGDEIYPTGYPGVVIRAYGIAKGIERTSIHPIVSSDGYRIYELDEYSAPANTAAELATSTTAYNNAVTTRDTAKTTLTTANAAAGTAGAACAISTIDPNAYLKDATVEDIEFLTLNDYTFVLNKKKTVEMKATPLSHPNVDPHRAQVVIQIASNATVYSVLLTQGGSTSTFSHTSSSSGASSDNIAAALQSLIDANAAYSATQVGGTVYITSSSAFSVEVRGGIQDSSIYAVTDAISNQSLLPLQSKDGYVVRVVNSEDLDIDDMFVKFTTDGSQAFGTGNWEETLEPGLKYQFNELTMPHQLVRQADGTFVYSSVNWNDRLVGNDDTNPEPSFVGHTISHIFFYRNRMGFLSGQNVILSKAGDLFNFWNTSAQTAVNDDPIDISAAGKRPAFLNYVEPTSVGLVLYATNEQFLLSTDSDILAPTSAKVNSLSAYECDANVESVSLGTSQAFISKTPLYTRLFELTDVTSEQPPLMADITNVVPEFIPESVDTMVSSPALSVVSMGATGSTTLYQYRFLARSREERLVNCWYKWDLTGNLLTQFFDSSTFFTCVSNASDVYVQSYDMTQSSEEGFLTLPTGEKTDVCLDLFDINPAHSYDSANDKTIIRLPYAEVSGKQLKVVVLGGFIGDENVLSSQSVGAVLAPTIQTDADGSFVEINGNFQGRDLIIGYNYDMSIKLPQLYRYSESGGQIKNDDVSSLILHRIKVKTGLSGPVDYKVSITGLADYTETISVTQPNQYQLNSVNMQASSTHVVPVFQRNENLAIEIIGNTPFPVSLLGLDWEGKLNQRFYRRG